MKRSITFLALTLLTLPASISGAFSAAALSAYTACELYIPNAFSPNDDGRNDIFKPVTNCLVLEYELHIYNRWGSELFTSRSPDQGWNGEYEGQALPQGVYVYMIKYSLGVGEVTTDKVEKGELVLVR